MSNWRSRLANRQLRFAERLSRYNVTQLEVLTIIAFVMLGTMFALLLVGPTNWTSGLWQGVLTGCITGLLVFALEHARRT
jgi:thiamine transporter ThiT